MVNTENSPGVFKHFQTMSFIPTRKAVYCNLPRSRGVIKQAIGINIKCRHENKFLLANYKAKGLIIKLF